MPHLIWSQNALQDIQRLYQFLYEKSPESAANAIQAIRQQLLILEQMPHIGRPVPDEPEEVRDWVIKFGSGGYVARYRLRDTAVVIAAVRHQREAGF